MLSKKLVHPKILIPAILWLPNGKPITPSTDVPYEAARPDGRPSVIHDELEIDSVESMLQHVMTACHIDMDMVESHFKSIGTGCSSGTRIVVLIDGRDPIFVNDGDDILIVERKRLPQHRPGNSWMDYSFRAYLELIYRKAETQDDDDTKRQASRSADHRGSLVVSTPNESRNQSSYIFQRRQDTVA